MSFPDFINRNPRDVFEFRGYTAPEEHDNNRYREVGTLEDIKEIALSVVYYAAVVPIRAALEGGYHLYLRCAHGRTEFHPLDMRLHIQRLIARLETNRHQD